MKNGGFEEGLMPWKSFSYWLQCPMNGTIAEVQAHSGRYSLFSEAGQSGQGSIATVIFNPDGSISTITSGVGSGYCVGGGAYQVIDLEQNPKDMKLSAWVHLKGIQGETSGTDISIIIWFLTEGGPKIIAYYVAWSYNVPIYKNFPGPTTGSENVTNILIQNVRSDRWNYVELDLEKDFKESYPSIDFSSIQQLTVQLISAGIKGGGTTNGAFWDDLSLKYESVSTTTPQSTPPPTTPVPTLSPSPTPTASSPEETQQSPKPSPTSTPTTQFLMGSVTEQWLLPVAVIGIIVAALAGVMLLKRKSSRTSVSAISQESATREIGAKQYCLYCGAVMSVGSNFCKKCGKRQ